MNIGNAQVRTKIAYRVITSEIIKGHVVENPDVHTLPAVDVQAVLKEDKRQGRIIDRFGIETNATFDISEGKFYEKHGRTVWKLAIYSRAAKSLNFRFSDLVLPGRSEMFIYNEDETMVIGPITSKNVHEGRFNSDLIHGSTAFIEVKIDESSDDDFNINISNIIHGIELIEFRIYGDSSPCNIDVDCPGGPGIGLNQLRDAVALILLGGTGWCSGSLIHNVCQDFTPFFLTANHCINTQAAAQNSVFRFNYESPNPTQPNCRGADDLEWVSFSGSIFTIGQRNEADYSLLLLNNLPAGLPNISYLGWDRQEHIPILSSSMHHPRGDVKKVAIMNNFVLNPSGVIPNTPTGLFYNIDLVEGWIEHVSSGSPWVDGVQRIIGLTHGGNGIQECDDPAKIVIGGRFSAAWTGGTNPNLGLFNILGAGMLNPPQNITSSVAPLLDGPDFLCTNDDFTLFHPSANSYTWTVSPTNLFAGSTNGIGNVANLTVKSPSSQGEATITFDFYVSTGFQCQMSGAQQISRTFWVGKPLQPVIDPSGNPPINLTLGDKFDAEIIDNGFNDFTAIQWSTNGSITPSGPINNQICFFDATSTGSGTYFVNTSNVCGQSNTTSGQVNVTSTLLNPIVTFSPNPVREQLYIYFDAQTTSQKKNHGI